MAEAQPSALPAATRRTASFMTHPVFSSHQSEHQMLRYIFKLAQRDISLVHCMIPLGSCTMKLNATAEMMPITWPALNRIHPFAPAEQTQGYAELITSFEDILCEITGFPGMSLQVRARIRVRVRGRVRVRVRVRARARVSVRVRVRVRVITHPNPTPTRIQPNSGATGEYAGLRAIRAYQQAEGEGHRDVCLIPVSAHGLG